MIEINKKKAAFTVLKNMNPFYRITEVVTKPLSSLKQTKGVLVDIKNSLNPIGSYKRAKEKSRTETFGEACMRLNVNNEMLLNQYNSFVVMSKLALVICAVLLFLSFYNLIISNYLVAPMLFSMSIFNLSVCHRYTFRAYQIKKNKLGNHEDFLKDKSAWLPKFANTTK